MSSLDEQFISTKEAAERSGYNPDYLSRLCREGKIQGRQIGRAWLVSQESLEAFVKSQTEHNRQRAELLSKQREAEYKKSQASNEPVASAPFLAARGIELPSVSSVRPSARSLAAVVLTVVSVGMGAAFAHAGYVEQASAGVVAFAQELHDHAAISLARTQTTESARATQAAAPHTQTLTLAQARDSVVRTQLALTPATARTSFGGPVVAYAAASTTVRTQPRGPFSPARTLALARDPRSLAADVRQGYLTLGTQADASVAQGLASYVRSIDAAGEATLAAGSLARDAGTRGPSSLATTLIALGNTLASEAFMAPATAGHGYDKGVLAFVDGSERVQGSVEAKEYAAGVATGNARDLALGATAKAGTSAATFVLAAPSAAADTLLGAAGQTAVAAQAPQSLLASAWFAAGSVSEGLLHAGEDLAILAFGGVSDVAYHTSRAMLALLQPLGWTLGSSGNGSELTVVPFTATSTGLAIISAVVPSAPFIVGDGAPQGSGNGSIVNTYPTTVIDREGVSQGEFASAIADLRSLISAQSEEIVQTAPRGGGSGSGSSGGSFNGSDIDAVSGTFGSLAVTNNASVGGTLTAGTTTVMGLLTASSSTISGDLTVGGTLTAGALAVGSLSSMEDVVAPFFTAASTTATSTFPNLFATNGTITNFIASNASITTLGATSATFTNATTTNASSTNAYAANLTAGTATINLLASGQATSTSLYATTLGVGGSYFSSLLGAGLANVNGVLSVATSSFSGAGSGLNADFLDGFDSTYYLANSFSSSSADYWLTGKTTSNLAEGSNLYYTDARARGALSVAGSPLSYDNTTGIFGIDQASRAQAGYLSASDFITFDNKISSTSLSGGAGIAYDSNTGSISNTGVLTFNGRVGDITPTSGDYTTDLIPEGANLYYTLARFAAALAGTTTDALAEGTDNLYYTQGRFDTAFAGKSTDDLTEGSNLYYTDARAQAAISTDATGLTYDNTTGVLGLDPSYSIPLLASTTDWNTAYLSRITSASAPLSIANHVLSLARSSRTTDGYLAASDFTSFDNKISSTSLSGSGPISYNPNTGVFSFSTTSISGSGFGFDADFLDGFDSTYYLANSFSTSSADYWLTGKTTDDLAEGANLYYTQSRFDTAFAAKSTDDLTEGSNLYYTDARAQAALSSSALGLDYDDTTGIFSLAAGYVIPTTASTSAWQTFYQTPSARITAGTNLSWVGNTLNGPTDSYIRSLLSASSPISYNSSTGAFSFSTSSISGSGSNLNADFLDGLNSSYYLANSFSTSSADYWLTGKSTDDLTEGSNLYYTQGRFDVAFGAKTTDDLTEGSSLYYTDARARAAISVTGAPLTYSGGVIGINQANLSQAGYLSALDYGRFDNKISSTSLSALTPLTYDSTTGVFDLGTVPVTKGGTGITSYTSGDVLYADNTGTLQKLPAGSNGQVLQIAAGLPAWGSVSVNSLSGGDGIFATSTGITYPVDTSRTVIIGTNATSTLNSIFEVSGQAYISSKLGIGTTSPSMQLSVTGNGILSGNLTLGGSLVLGGSSFSSLLGTGLTNTGGVLTVSTSSLALDTTYYRQNGNAFGGLATLGTTDSNALRFITGGTERARIDTNGYLGIGTNSPTGRVQIGGNFSDASWTVNGKNFSVLANTLTDTSSLAGDTPPSRASASFGIPTFGSTNSVTVSEASNVYIAGAPLPGPNTTFGGTFALMVASGNTKFKGFNFFGNSNSAVPVSNVAVGGNVSAPSWTTTGLLFSTGGSALTDTSSVAATTISQVRAANSFAPSSLASTNAITVTNAATLYIGGAPTQGTNTTITNSSALYVAGGSSFFGGAVGIGTSSPMSATSTLASGNILQVGGSTAGSTGTLVLSSIGSTGQRLGAVSFQGSGTTFYEGARIESNAINGTSGRANLVFYTSNALNQATEAMRITETGSIGVGTTTPSGTLSVQQVGATPAFYLQGVANNSQPTFQLVAGASPNAAVFSVVSSSGASLLTVGPSAGNVGIGSSTPFAKLSVQGTGTGTGVSFQTTDSSQSPKFTVLDNGLTFVNNAYSVNPLSSSALTINGPHVDTVGGGIIKVISSGTSAHLDIGITNGGSTTVTNRQGYIQALAGAVGVNESASDFSLNPFGGNVSIGTTSAAQLLDVSGTRGVTVLSSNSGIPGIGITNISTTTGNFSQLAFQTTDLAGAIGISSKIVGVNTSHTAGAISGDLAFLTSNAGTVSEAMRITASNTVGIGTSTPWGQLSVNPNALGSGVPEFVVGSTSATHFIVTGAGNIGIGTTTPSTLLSLQSTTPTINLQSASSQTSTIRLTESGTNGTYFKYDGSASIGTLGTFNGTNFVDTISMTRTTGNVGIGSTSPLARLDVAGANNGTNPLFQLSSVASFATTTRFIVTNAGSVGVGTTSPYAKLSVVDSSSATPFAVFSGIAAVPVTVERTTSASNVSIEFKNSTASWFAGQAANGNFSFATSNNLNSGSLQVATGGNVGIGTTTPGSILSIGGVANFSTATSTFYSAGGLNLTGGCYAVNGTCLSVNSLGGTLAIANGGTNATSQTTNGVNYFDGTKITSGTGLTFDGTNLGVGTTTPSSLLSIQGSSAYLSIQDTRNTDSWNVGDTLSGIDFRSSDSSGTGNVGKPRAAINAVQENTSGSQTGLAFLTGGIGVLTERLRISSSSGFVGIGTTSPIAALALGSGQIAAPAGSVSAPSYSFGTDLTTGIYSSAPGGINFTTSGINRFNIGNSFTSNSANGAAITSSATSGTVPTFIPNRSDTTTGLGADASGNLSFITAGTTKLEVLNGGNVGIGTSTPWGQLSVNPNALAAGVPEFVIGSSTVTHFIVTGAGNVGIGTTSPMAALSLAAGQLVVPNGTAAAPSYSFSSFPDTGFYGTGVAGQVAFSASGSQRFRFNGSSFEANNATGLVLKNASANSGTAPVIILNTADQTTGFASGATGNINAIVAGVEVSRWTSTGFGIGSTSPLARLDVAGANNGTNPLFQLSSVASFATTTRFIVTNGGNVGIGSTTPENSLTIATSGATAATFYRAGGLNSTIEIRNGVGSVFSGVNPSGNFGFGFQASLASAPLIIASSTGYVGIGATAPGSLLELKSASDPLASGLGTRGNYNLLVRGTSNTTGATTGVAFVSDGSDVNNVGASILYRRTGSNAQGALDFYTKQSSVSNANPGLVMTLSETGMLGIGTSSPATKLEVADTGVVLGRITSTNTGNAGLDLQRSGGTSYRLVTSGSSLAIQNTTDSYNTLTDLFRITSTGNVGIGTTSPFAKLSVVGQTVSEYFTATSTTATSTFPNLFATNLRLAGGLYDSTNATGANGQILQTTGTGVQWVSTTTLGFSSGTIASGGTNATSQTTNGVNYFDGTKITSGSALTFDGTNLALTSGTITPGTQYLGAGSVNNPLYSFTGDLTTGMFHPSSNQVGFATGGVQRVVIDGAGNVGIGSSTPFARLSITGSGAGAGRAFSIANATNADLFYVRDDGVSFLNGNLTVTGSTTAATVIDSGLTSNRLVYADALNRLSSVTLGSSLSFTGGVLSVSTSTFSGSGSGLNADLLDGLDSSYFVANSFSSTSADYWLTGKTTDNLTEGSNLYYSQGRFDIAFSGKSTDDLTEGSRLYYTDARADARINATSTIGTLTSAPSLGTVSTALSGILRATAGVLSTGAINLGSSDVTGSVSIARGGTNASAQTSGGVNYFDGTKITSGSMLTFDGTNVSLASTGQYLGVGSVGNPLYSFTGDLTTGMFHPSSNQVGFATGGVQRAVIDASGFLGVGTTSPYAALSVVGDEVLTGSLTLPSLTNVLLSTNGNGTATTTLLGTGLTFSGNTLSVSTTSLGLDTTYFKQGGNSFGALATLGTSDSNALRFVTGGVERARVDTAGNVGIGTTSPFAKLSVVGQTVSEYFTATSTTATSTFPNLFATNLRLAGGLYDSTNATGANGQILQTTGTGVQWVSTTTLGFSSGTIASGGTNATSQTTNGVNYFDGTKITSGSALTFDGTNLALTSGTITPGTQYLGAGSVNNPLYSFTGDLTTGMFHPSSNQVGFATGGVQRVVIDGNGFLGIGTSSPSVALSVQGNALFSGNLALASFTATGTATFSGLSTGIAHLSSTGVLSSSAVALGGADVTGTLTVGNGGTGSTTLSGILVGNGTSALNSLTVSAPLAFSGSTLSIAQANASTNGYLSSTDFASFTNKISSTSLSAVYPLAYSSSTGVFTTAFSTTTANAFNQLQQFNANASSTQLTVTGNTYLASSGGLVGIGTSAIPVSMLGLSGSISAASWTTTGKNFSVLANTLTDTSSAAAATIPQRASNSFGIPTFDSTNAITVSEAANLYIAGAPAGTTNTTITNTYALEVAAGNSKFKGQVYFGNSVNGAITSNVTIGGQVSSASWTTTGPLFASGGSTLTDNSSTGGATITQPRAENSFIASALDSTNAITVNNAATLYISGAPTGTGNTTVLNSSALYVAGGSSFFGGAVGIGTTSPTSATSTLASGTILQVGGSAGGSTGTLVLSSSGSTGQRLGAISFQGGGSTFYEGARIESNAINGTNGRANLVFYTSNVLNQAVEAMRITETGSVGIGTTSPTVALEVSGTAANTNEKVRIDAPAARAAAIGFASDSTNNWWLGRYDSDIGSNTSFFIGSDTGNVNDPGGNSAKLSITSAGLVGIGTSTPTGSRLEVSGTNSIATLGQVLASSLSITNLSQLANSYAATNFNTADSNGLATSTAQIAGIATTHTANALSGDLAFLTQNAGSLGERLRITAAGNVGIGTTTPFSRLSVTGAGISTGRTFSLANSANNDLFYVQDNGLGYFGGSFGIGSTSPWGQLSVNPNGIAGPAFVIGSSTATRFIVTNGGNVGIGSTTPENSLTIATAGASAATFYRAGGLNSTIEIRNTLGSVFAGVNPSGNLGLGFSASLASAPLIIASTTGNVGIGSSTPENALTVASTNASIATFYRSVASNAAIETRNTVGSYFLGTNILGNFGIGTTNNLLNPAQFTIASSTGNIGLGTTTPATTLDVNGSAQLEGSSATLAINPYGLISDTNYVTATARAFFGYDGVARMATVQAVGGRGINFNVNNNTFGSGNAMTITSAANVGIGTTTPDAKLGIAVGSAGSPTLLRLENDGNWAADRGLALDFNTPGATGGGTSVVGARIIAAGDTSTNQSAYLSFSTRDTTATLAERARITQAGNFGIGTTSPAATFAVQGNALFSGNLSLANLTATGTATLAAASVTGTANVGQLVDSGLSASSLVYANGSKQLSSIASGADGQVLIASSTSPTGFDWSTVSGTGTVTSVQASGGTTGLTFSGGPVTGAGTLTLAGTLGVTNGGTGTSSEVTNGIAYFDGTAINSSGAFTFNGSKLAIGSSTPTGLLSIDTQVSTSPYVAVGSTTSTLFTVAANGAVGIGLSSPVATNKLSITGATGNTGILIAGVTTGTGISAATVTTGSGLVLTGLTTGTGVNATVTTTGTAFNFNSTAPGLTTASAFKVNGSATITGDFLSSFITVTPTRTMTAAATRTESGNMVNISPTYSITGASAANFNVTGTTTNITRAATISNSASSFSFQAPVLSLASSLTCTAGTCSDTGSLLSLWQGNTNSTGTGLALNNQGTGNLATFIGSGSVGIGTTTPTAQLHTTGTVRFSNFGAGTLQTDAAGNVTVSSDERLKDINGGFTRGLADIEKLSPILYHWNAISGLDQSTQYAGFSAQNVQGAIPEAVDTDPRGYLSLQDRPILAAAVNAIKQLAGGYGLTNPGTGAQSVLSAYAGTGVAAITIDPTGQVGIGTKTPTKMLSVQGDATISGNLAAGSVTLTGDATLKNASAQTVSASRIIMPLAQMSFGNGTSTMAANLPSEVLVAVNGDQGVDLYRLATYTLATAQTLALQMQSLNLKVDTLSDRVAALEAESLMASALGSASSTVALTSDSLKTSLHALGIFVSDTFTQVKTMVAENFVFGKNSNGDSAAGTGTLIAGNTVVEVDNVYMHATSKVSVTMTANVTGTWYLSQKEEGKFRIVFSEAQAQDVSFDYFIVQTEVPVEGAAVSSPHQIFLPNDGSGSGSTTGTDASSTPSGTASSTPSTTASSTPSGAPGADTTAPVVRLNGDAAVQVVAGAGWTDPGATALDDTDGDLTSGITVTGLPDTHDPGLYTVTYTATDVAGNAGHASRVVTVMAPTVAPAPADSTPAP